MPKPKEAQVILESHLHRIRAQVSETPVEGKQAARQAQLSMTSKKRSQQWTNTLEGNRIRKELLKEDKLRQEEAEFQRMEQEEEALAEANRCRIVQDTTRQLRNQDPTRRALARSVLLCELSKPDCPNPVRLDEEAEDCSLPDYSKNLVKNALAQGQNPYPLISAMKKQDWHLG